MVSNSLSSSASLAMRGAAYQLAIQHALKHASRPVFGVLLGRETHDEDENGHQTHSIHIDRVVPAFHNYPSTPLAHICLQHVEIFARTCALQVLGVYTANEIEDDHSLSTFAMCIAESIQERNGRSCIWSINNSTVLRLADDADDALQEIYVKESGVWISLKRQKWARVLDFERAVQSLRAGYKKRTFASVIDFEEHLADIALDWRNGELHTGND